MAGAAEIRIHRGQRAPIEIDVGGSANIVVVPNELPAIEFGDINFRLDHAAMVPPLSEQEIARTSGKDPKAEKIGPPDPEFRALMAEAVLARVFEFLAANPHKLVCIAGHTDAAGSTSHNDQLSENRALSVALYLKAGAREAWAKHSFKQAQADDYQQVLTFAHLTRGYYCNPRGIDGDFGAKSQQALKNFKLAYNADFHGKLQLDGTRREEDWLAFYDIYDELLSQTLGLTRAQLALQRELVLFTDPAVLGCGERFPLGDADDPDAPPAQYAPRDRRVDILFFDGDELPDLRAQPPGKSVYAQGDFVLQGVPVPELAKRPERPVVEVLEVSDANFHTGRCVLLPSSVPGVDAPGISAAFTFGTLHAILEDNNWQKIICVAGHTDTEGGDAKNDELSADRAQNVLLYLAGEASAWAEHSFAHQKDDDYQRILTWIAMTQSFDDVYPGTVDGAFGSKSKAALKAFKQHWNKSFASAAGLLLVENDERVEQDFLAFFFLYDQALKLELDTDDEGLIDFRQNLIFAPLAAIGCGEHWTIEAIGEDNHASQRNRRVDILLFDPGEVPELHALPIGLLVYGVGRFQLEYVNQKIRVPMIDLADTHFRTARSVLMPAPTDADKDAKEDAKDAKGTEDAKQTDVEGSTLEQAFVGLFKVLARFPEKRVLVAGHTDSVGSEAANLELSADRAESVLFYLGPDMKDQWVAHADKHHADEDYQQVLTWANQVKSAYKCDPGGIDNAFGANSQKALAAFKRGFNAEFGAKLPEDGTKRKDDWGAFYDLYDDMISRALALKGNFAARQKALNDKRKSIQFTDPAAIGCGENFTIDKAGEDAVPSKRNRRVDILLLDQDEIPPLDTDPPGLAIYGMGRFILASTQAVLGEPVLKLQDIPGPNGIPLAFTAWDLLQGEEVLESGETDADGNVNLATEIAPGTVYTLQYAGTSIDLQKKAFDPVASPKGRAARLAFLGYNPGALDKVDDVQCNAALGDFQRDHGFIVTGEANAAVDAKLVELAKG